MNPLKRKTKANRDGKPSKKEFTDNLVNNTTKLIYKERKEAETRLLQSQENMKGIHNHELESLRLLYKKRMNRAIVISISAFLLQGLILSYIIFR